MRKKSGELSAFLPTTTLYLGDINELYAILSRNAKTVSLETADYELDGINELTHLGTQRLKLMGVHAREPTVSVIFRRRAVQIYASADDTISRGIVDEIKDFFAKRRRPFSRLFPDSTLRLVPLSILGTALSVLSTQLKDRTAALTLSSTALALTAYAVIGILVLVRGNALILAPRNDVKSWWKRNGDALLVATIAGTTGVVVGGLIVFLITRR